jgi:hypothetical protein
MLREHEVEGSSLKITTQSASQTNIFRTILYRLARGRVRLRRIQISPPRLLFLQEKALSKTGPFPVNNFVT